MKKKKKASRRKPVAVAEPPPVNLNRYVDFVTEAEKFELPVRKVKEIAQEIELEHSPSLAVKVTQSESALKEKLEAIYSQEAASLEQCPFPACERTFPDIHAFLIHQRMHIITEAPDFKTRAAVIRDIERVLVPSVEKTAQLDGALTAAERQKLIKTLQTKGLLED